MELIENDRADAFESGSSCSRRHPLGDHLDAGRGRDLVSRRMR